MWMGRGCARPTRVRLHEQGNCLESFDQLRSVIHRCGFLGNLVPHARTPPTCGQAVFGRAVEGRSYSEPSRCIPSESDWPLGAGVNDDEWSTRVYTAVRTAVVRPRSGCFLKASHNITMYTVHRRTRADDMHLLFVGLSITTTMQANQCYRPTTSAYTYTGPRFTVGGAEVGNLERTMVFELQVMPHGPPLAPEYHDGLGAGPVQHPNTARAVGQLTQMPRAVPLVGDGVQTRSQCLRRRRYTCIFLSPDAGARPQAQESEALNAAE
ncbi:hypothetical protein C8Q73DRAFT_682516 [Cubamyces lactineus]|nr:hypothetical protein C8Q73DRAFT_682516 [Cubamyces lactineus]